MSVQITIQVDGVEAINRLLEGYVEQTSDLTLVWRGVVAEVRQTTERTFALEGAVDGLTKWPDLTTAYRDWKDRHHPGKTILERTGALKQAATNPDVEIKPLSLKLVVSNPEYAVYHQSPEPRTSNLPRRAFWRLEENEPQKQRIVQIVREFVWKEP